MSLHHEYTALQDIVANAIANGRETYLVLDFDGPVAPLVDDPANSRPDFEILKAIDDLTNACPTLHIAFVTGRDVRFMRDAVGDDIHIVGSHGVEYHTTGEQTELHKFSKAEQSLVDGLKSRIKNLAETSPELSVELDKHGSVSVKSANPETLQQAVSMINTAERSADNTQSADGKTFVVARESDEEVEFRPNEMKFGKAYGLERFIQPPGEALVVFAGDSFKQTGTDYSIARLVKARGPDHGQVVRVENGRVSRADIPEDAVPDATFSGPQEWGRTLQGIAAMVQEMKNEFPGPAA